MLYDYNLLNRTSFALPTIVVGNLAVGGSGKSPVTEYLIRLLKTNYKVATLSRGYGRSTKGYKEVAPDSLATEVGDEPLQFKQKFTDITVAVSESRVIGVDRLQHQHDVVVLDDAYQHRALVPGFSILLFDYATVFQSDFLLPAGRQRESFTGRKRADVLLVTKCPVELSAAEKEKIKQRLRPLDHQRVVFAHINYAPLQSITGTDSAVIAPDTMVLLLTGIANPKPLYTYLHQQTVHIKQLKYPDHYAFTNKDMQHISHTFAGIEAANKLLITTEKDAMRLLHPNFLPYLKDIPLFIIPIHIGFNEIDKAIFDDLILNYVKQHTKNSSLHSKES